MNKLKYKLQEFMMGRYGIDEFYYFLFIVYAILLVINCFVRSAIISTVIWLLLFYTLFRITSKNVSARHKENAKYLLIKNKVIGGLKIFSDRIKDKEHIYKRCPYCKATIRFPRKKGKHNAVCPRCNGKFKVNVW